MTGFGMLLIVQLRKSFSQQRKSLKKSIIPKEVTTILIGPEGDFSTKEIELSKLGDFIPVTLGHSRLRTETAGVLAAHTVALMND